MEMDLEHERRLTEVDDRSKSNKHRLDKVEAKQIVLEELAVSVKVLATRQENVENDVKEIKNDVKELTIKPAKRWEALLEKAVGLIVATFIGFILAQIGL